MSNGRHALVGMDNEEFPKDSFRYRRRGEELAEGFRAVFCGMKHDRPAEKDCHDHVRWFKASFICKSCLALRPTAGIRISSFSFTHLNLDAAWLATRIDHATYMREEIRISPYIRHIRGLRLDTLFDDWMHDGYLGVCGTHVANHLAFASETVHGSFRKSARFVFSEASNVYNDS